MEVYRISDGMVALYVQELDQESATKALAIAIQRGHVKGTATVVKVTNCTAPLNTLIKLGRTSDLALKPRLSPQGANDYFTQRGIELPPRRKQ